MSAHRVFRRSHSISHLTARSARKKPTISSSFLRSLLAAILLGLGVAFVIVQKPKIVVPTIQTISCSLPNFEACPESLIQQLSALKGQPLLFTNLDQAVTVLVQPLGFTSEAYTRVLPDTLQLQLKPLNVLFYAQYGSQKAAITAQGVALTSTTTDDNQLLVISVTNQKTITQLASEASVPFWLVQTVRELQPFFASMNLQPTSIELRSPFELEIALVDQPHVILMNPQESSLNLARLSSILKSKQDLGTASANAKLDVRFRLPVLRS